MCNEKQNFHLSPLQADELHDTLVKNKFFNNSDLQQLSDQLEGYIEKHNEEIYNIKKEHHLHAKI